MKTMDFIKKIAARGCVIFTIVTLIVYSIGSIVSDSERSFIPSIKFIWLFFAFSVLLAAANEILSVKKISLGVRMLIHFAVCAALYFVCVVLCGGFISSGAQTLIAMTMFVIVYLICGIFIAIVLSRREKKSADNEKYQSQFR